MRKNTKTKANQWRLMSTTPPIRFYSMVGITLENAIKNFMGKDLWNYEFIERDRVKIGSKATLKIHELVVLNP